MKIWTRGSSPRSGSRNAWTWIKNVSGTSRLSNFWNFFCAFQMISCRDCWPWTKRGYITVTRIQSSNQWSGGIAAHPAPKKFRMQKFPGKIFASIFWDQNDILLIDYLPNGQTIKAEYHSSLLVQLKDILKEKRCGKFNKVFFFLHENAPTHQALATQKKLDYLGFQCLDHTPILRIWPRLTTTCSLVWKKQLKVRHFSSDAEVIAAAETWLDGPTCDFSFFEWLAKVIATGLEVYWASWRVCWTKIEGLVALGFFLPGRAKVLSAHPLSSWL